MALTIKHLNSDASFLLSFEPIIPQSVADSIASRPFTILLDPWVTGSSSASQKRPACISSLKELSSPPDLVVISQRKSDHCNEATLRQLPASGTDTLILAEPASARLIKSWKYFDREKIRIIEKWEDPRVSDKQTVIRIPVPALRPGSGEGEVTVAFIPQKRDRSGMHGAIGITYRPPHTHSLAQRTRKVRILTPPTTPESDSPRLDDTERDTDIEPPVAAPLGDTFLLPPTPPISPTEPTSPTLAISPGSLRSVRSASTLIASPTNSLYSPTFRPVTSSQNEAAPVLSPVAHSRPLSVIFSPHGISYDNLAPYATSHLVSEAALPLTTLLQCMDSVSSPWWLGGNTSAGVPQGAEIAANLFARLWISAQDNSEKDVRGRMSGMLKTRRWNTEEIEGALESGFGDKRDSYRPTSQYSTLDKDKTKAGVPKTEVMRLKCGEEILVSGTGCLWRTTTKENDLNTPVAAAATKPRVKLPILPAPKFQAGGIATDDHHEGKYYNNTGVPMTLPKVQDDMSPKRPTVYRTLRTKDLIMPSPKLMLERDFDAIDLNGPSPTLPRDRGAPPRNI
ncbi:hypothetical protein GGS20DRAFT_218664 [Poronia punctata]|nr:hypothetical protein GGS20DRAFT_218664 [Poronia punctata]